MTGLFGQALREIARRRVSTVFSVLGFAVGAAALLLLTVVGQVGSSKIQSELTETGLLGLQIKGSEKSGGQKLNAEDLAVLQALPAVRRAAPVLTGMSTVSAAGKAGECVVWGATEGDAQIFPLTLKYGRLLGKGDLTAQSRCCLVDSIFATAYYKRENIVGREIEVTLNGRAERYEVVGVVASGGALTQGILGSFVPYFVYLPYPAMQEQGGYTGFSQVAVELKATEKERKQVISETVRALEQKTGRENGFSYEDMEQRSQSVSAILSTLSGTLSAMGLVTLLIAGLSVFLMMQAAVRERRVEIGIQKALGATNQRIAMQFLTEAALLAFAGGSAGLLLTGLLLSVGSSLLLTDLSIPLFSQLLFLFAMTLFGGLCSLMPAVRAAKCDPAEAFRSL